MFAPETEKLVEQLIQAEYINACEKFGEKYNSLHEGYAILLEEVEEVKSEVEKLSANLDVLWRKIKSNDTDIKYLSHHMCSNACNVILESVQVGAVLQKIKNTFGEVKKNV